MNKENSYTLAALEFMREFDLDQCEHCPYQDGNCLGQCADNIIDENTIWDEDDDDEI